MISSSSAAAAARAITAPKNYSWKRALIVSSRQAMLISSLHKLADQVGSIQPVTSGLPILALQEEDLL